MGFWFLRRIPLFLSFFLKSTKVLEILDFFFFKEPIFCFCIQLARKTAINIFCVVKLRWANWRRPWFYWIRRTTRAIPTSHGTSSCFGGFKKLGLRLGVMRRGQRHKSIKIFGWRWLLLQFVGCKWGFVREWHGFCNGIDLSPPTVKASVALWFPCYSHEQTQLFFRRVEELQLEKVGGFG